MMIKNYSTLSRFHQTKLTSTIATGGTASHATPVAHPDQHLVGILHDLSTCHGF
jgi:hypothetical protein